MKKYIVLVFFCLTLKNIQAQNNPATSGNTIDLKDLAVPTSPAFLLLDVGSTAIESPVNPKEFALGLAQNFDAGSKWFNDYSLEFTPYWWVKPGSRSAYGFMGLKKDNKENYVQDYFSGLKFTSISLAFINKDMIPDTATINQKIVSIGARTTVLKIRNRSYAVNLNVQLKNFHDVIFKKSLDTLQTLLAPFLTDPQLLSDTAKMHAKVAEMTKKFQDEYYLANIEASDAIKELKSIIEEKPLLNIDVAGAFSQYGVGDTVWKTGRTGIWTTISSFTPISKEKGNNSYIDILASVRYLSDHYVLNEEGHIGTSATFDAGFKIGIEINKFSIFAEGMWRKVSRLTDWQNRITGVLNYQVKENIYLSGTYGTDFGPANKIIALFGVNWGFGSEKVNMSEPK